MQTPIAEFVQEYAEKRISRFHMPGHKGRAFLGCEGLDITEIAGADALYEAEGIIAESEKNASSLFGTKRTVFSTEGSSQCIRAMLYLAAAYQKAKQHEKKEPSASVPTDKKSEAVRAEDVRFDEEKEQAVRPYVIAARNVHKAFLYAAALVDFDVVWLYPKESNSICSCQISVKEAEAELQRQLAVRSGQKPAAIYVTSPDYLGGQLELAAFSKLCHRYDILLAVDNAHGAYLHFLEQPTHPMDLGADICCDSAHKTLPALTGGAYLQIGKNAPDFLAEHAKQAMALFGSTSPSYLILQSLDLCNAYLAKDYPGKLQKTMYELKVLRNRLQKMGWQVLKTDPLKLTLHLENCGIGGTKLAAELRSRGIECEYADADYLVLMATPENGEKDFKRLAVCMEELAEKLYTGASLNPKMQENPNFSEKESTRFNAGRQPLKCFRRLSIRNALFAEQEIISVKEALGRICGAPTVGCPPAIPIVVSGEEINEAAIALFLQYGITAVAVVKENVG